jgi:hypothetical protein
MKLEIEDTELIALLINLKDRLAELERKLERPPIVVKEYIPYPVVESIPYYPPTRYPWEPCVIYGATTTGTIITVDNDNTISWNSSNTGGAHVV